MDELVVSPSSCSPPYFSGTACFPMLEFELCEVPEQWLLGLGDVDGLDKDAASALAAASQSASSDVSRHPPAAVRAERTAKRRGRKPGPRAGGAPSIGHVEAERQRREKLNRRFCDLRAAVPTVSRMDKASLLADAAAYIAELRRRVDRLEAEAAARRAPLAPSAAAAWAAAPGSIRRDDLVVRMVGRDAAMLRLTTTAAAAAAAAATRHAPARMMCALRALNLPVQHASVTRVGGATVQDVTVDDVPAALQDEGCLRAALLHRLQLESGVWLARADDGVMHGSN